MDGDGDEAHKWYRYGGMWKNKHEAVSAKMRKPKARKAKGEVKGNGEGVNAAGEEEGREASGSEREKEGGSELDEGERPREEGHDV